MANQVFVSPGVYTSELDLTYVTRQVGVTTLGLVGETTQGPAFQPIFVSDYNEFQTFFGGLNNTLINGPDGNGAPQYELAYIAKSYLSQSNQLFVTRVLGYSGYHAGQAWGITLSAALDPATTGTTYSASSTATYSASTGGTIYSITTSDPVINAYFAVSPTSFATLGTVSTGTTINIAIPQTKTGLVFNGGSIGMTITNTGSTPNVVLSTTPNTYSGASYVFTYTANTITGSIVAINSNDPLVNFYAANASNGLNAFTYVLGTTAQTITTVGPIFAGTNYTGGTITTTTTQTGTTGSFTTGTTSGSTILVIGYNANNLTGTTSNVSYTYSGSGYSDVEGKVIALIRSRATVPASTQLPAFQITGTTNLGLDSTITGATVNPLGTFSITGNSNTQGSFSYSLTFDITQKNYLSRALGRGATDKKTAIFVEEFYENIFTDDNNNGKIYGINQSFITYNNVGSYGSFDNYLQQYQPAVTPYVVSEVKGNKVLRLFRFWTISDGNAANSQIKISIANIRPDTLEFDVQIRSFSDTDARPQILESFSRCTMDTTSNKYIGTLIGTLDGTYASNSSYVLVEIDNNSDTSDSFPAGFVGYPVRNYQMGSNANVVTPDIMYKDAYGTYENPRKFYLGISDSVGIDNDFFVYKGVPPQGLSYSQWTGLTSGYHMDINASAVTIDDITEYLASGTTYSPIFKFATGIAPFQSEAGVVGTQYAQLYARKFTFVPYGGFDGWDIYRTRRSNLDSYAVNGINGKTGVSFGAFSSYPLQDGTIGNTSDYYAYQDAFWTFKNPEAVNINIFATPGIDTFDNQELVNSAIEMIENDRADSLYITTTPDADVTGTPYAISDVVDELNNNFDSNYTATYWPWVQILDSENNAYIYVPPTRDVVTNIALTDNIAFPWYAVAGVNRGVVNCIKARVKLAQTDRDTLYENRINPIATFTSSGVVIWGNKTLQVADTYLNRINIRRLLLQARKLISAVSIRLLFEQNDSIVRNQFLSLVNPILDNIRTERGLTDFRVVVNNSPEDIDNNQLTGIIYLKPTTALEFIQIQFTVMNNGASFANV